MVVLDHVYLYIFIRMFLIVGMPWAPWTIHLSKIPTKWNSRNCIGQLHRNKICLVVWNNDDTSDGHNWIE